MSGANHVAVAIFVAFVFLTIVITYLARGRAQTADGFYAANNSISAVQNGFATAGDYLSAASFLGTIAVFYSLGNDGVMYAVGAVAGWPVLTCLLSEKLRALGRYSYADVLCSRLAERPIRLMTSISTLSICGTYLIAQMVAAGTVVQVLFGLEYTPAVIIVGSLMVSYVLFGGMVATTWIQIVKATLLLAGALFMTALVLSQFGWSLSTLVEHAQSVTQLAPHGRLLQDPFSALCLALAFCFGPAGMPHILMRSFTVRSSSDARRSLIYATGLIALFQILVIVLGQGAIALLPHGMPLLGGPNMAAVHLGNLLGGELLFGVIASVTFATILAVVSGLTLTAATAVSHDLLRAVMPVAVLSEANEVRVSKLASIAIGAAAVALGILFQHQNVGFLATLPLVIAASANFPILLLALYWTPLKTRGAVLGGWVGLVSSIVMVVGSPKVWVETFGHAKALFPYEYPTLFTMGAAVLTAVFFSLAGARPTSSAAPARR